MFVFLSRNVIFNILLSIFVCAAASLFFAWLVSAHVFAPYVIAGSTHELQTCLFKSVPVLDFSAQIGKRTNPMETATGKFGLDLRNESADTLAERATSRKYKTIFQKKAGRRWTCESPNDVTKTEIDYILRNQQHQTGHSDGKEKWVTKGHQA